MKKKPRIPADGASGSLSPLTEGLRDAIASSGQTYYHIAERTAVSLSVISRFMRGKRDINMATADRLARYFGLKLVKGARRRDRS